MGLEEAQQRNRRRITVLAGVAAVNHWAVVAVLVSWLTWAQASRFKADDGFYPFLPFALIGAAAAALAVGWYAGRRVLGAARATVKALDAQPADGPEHQRLRNLGHELAIAAGIAPVGLAVLDDPVPNALTVGAGRRTTIVVTTGLLEKLTRDELEAVMAAQMCAIRRLDVALQTVVVACATGAIGVHRSFRDDWKDPREWVGIVLTFPSWLLAEWVRRSAFARCDLGADDMAVAITRHPDALRRALVKLLEDPGVVAAVTPANAALWFEPIPARVGKHERKRSVDRWSVLPSLESRIERLDAQVRER